jgi:ABC-type bacteriocin/lantibiotic exporter with double-glycine peptidase domain
LFKTVIKRFKWKLCRLFFLNLLSAGGDAVVPLFLKEIMYYIENGESNEELWRAVIFVIFMVVIIFLSRFIKEQLSFMQTKLGSQGSQALTGLIYSKVMKISNATNKKYKKGNIISFIQVDAPKIAFLFDTLPDVSRIPFLLIFLLITLYLMTGFTFFAAVGIIVIF